MLLPFAKIFSLCLRLFTRPTINLAKNALKKKSDHPPMVQDFLLSTGHLYHHWYTRLQRSFLPVASRSPIKPLSEEKALEAGVELISEMIVYGTLLGWGLYELRKVIVDSKRKDERQQALLSALIAQATEVERLQHDLETQVRSVMTEIQQEMTTVGGTEKTGLVTAPGKETGTDPVTDPVTEARTDPVTDPVTEPGTGPGKEANGTELVGTKDNGQDKK